MGKKTKLMRTRSTAVSLALMLTVGGMPINALAAEMRTDSAVQSILETSEAAKKSSRKKVSIEFATNGDVATGTTEGWSVTNTERGEIDVASVNALKESGDEGTDDDGNYCIWVKNRETTGAGAQQDLSGRLEVGKTYKFKGKLMYKDGPDQKPFRLEIQNGPTYRYRDNVVQFTAKKGEWTEFEGTYTIPESVTCEGKEWAFTDDVNYVFIETPWSGSPTKDGDLMDYYLDDFSMTTETGDEELAQNGDVEAGLEGWSTYEHNDGTTADLELVTTDDAHSGKKAVKVVNRAHTNDGVCQVFEDEFRPGYTYNFSAWVKQDQVDSQTISMTVRKGKEESFEPIVSAEVKKGEWTHLTGSYTFTEGDDTSIDKVFFETPWKSATNTKAEDLIDISVDDFSIIEKAMEADEGNRDYRDSDIKADLEVSEDEVLGVVNKEFEAKLKLDKLEKNSYKNLKVSVALPSIMGVEDVVFNKDAISGEASYKTEDGKLIIEVNGDDIGFDAEDGLFATVKLKLGGYVRKDTKADIVTEYAHIDGGKQTFYAVKDAKKTVMLKFLNTGAIAKQLGCSNPLVTQELGADPYALVYNDRVYVYMTADDYEYDGSGNLKDNSFGYIKTLRVISSSDMVNWTDHGEIKVAGSEGAAKWASHSWAPAIAHKNINGKDKFFVYFANDASGIGVLEGDTPIGPWKDPIGKALITRETPGCAGVTWCFDPAVLVDDDGSAYIYFGGGVPNDGRNGEQNNPHTARVAKLGDDMISIEGEALEIDAPAMFEDSGIFKYDGKYYYSYCSNFIGPHKEGYPGTGNIAYMTSDSPMGPFNYAGEIFDNPQKWFNVGGNNHHATFVFRGKSYFIYHAQTVAKELGKAKGYRSTHIDPIELDEDGNILPVKGTYEGISQLESMNPYKTIEAETIAWNKGIKVSSIDDVNRELTSLDDGDWTSVAGVDFGEKGADKFTAKVKSEKGGKIEVRLDSPEGSLIGTLEVPAGTDKYEKLSTEVTPVSGERNVFFVFRGEGEDLMTVDSYVFTEQGASEKPDTPEVDPDEPAPKPEPTPDTPAPKPSTPSEDPDTPAPTPTPTPTPDKPEEKPDKPEDKPAPTPDKPEEKPTPDKPEDKPAEEPEKKTTVNPEVPTGTPSTKASAGNGRGSTADQIAAPKDTTTLLSDVSGVVTVNASAKKLALKGDRGSFKVVSGKGVKVSKTGKLTIKKKAMTCVISYTVGGKEVTKTINIEKPSMEKKVTVTGTEATIVLSGTDISTAVWTTNKPKTAKVTVSPDGRHVTVTCSKKGNVKVSAEINGRKYTTTVAFK